MTTQPLSEYLASAYDAPEDDEARAAFRVEGPEQAAWAARKLAKAQAEISEVDRQALAEVDRINRWADSARTQPTRDRDFFTALLADWHRRLLDRELAEDAAGDWGRVKHKSRTLPNGVTVAARRNPDTWQVDRDAFVPWAEAHGLGDLVKVEKTPRIAEAKKALSASGTTVVNPETGEVVDGVTIVPGEVTIAVKVGDADMAAAAREAQRRPVEAEG